VRTPVQPTGVVAPARPLEVVRSGGRTAGRT